MKNGELRVNSRLSSGSSKNAPHSDRAVLSSAGQKTIALLRLDKDRCTPPSGRILLLYKHCSVILREVCRAENICCYCGI